MFFGMEKVKHVVEHRQYTGSGVLSMDRKPSPCRECDARHIGCHDQCEKYKIWRDGVDGVIKEKISQSGKTAWTNSRIKATNKWFKWRNDWWKK